MFYLDPKRVSSYLSPFCHNKALNKSCVFASSGTNGLILPTRHSKAHISLLDWLFNRKLISNDSHNTCLSHEQMIICIISDLNGVRLHFIQLTQICTIEHQLSRDRARCQHLLVHVISASPIPHPGPYHMGSALQTIGRWQVVKPYHVFDLWHVNPSHVSVFQPMRCHHHE